MKYKIIKPDKDIELEIQGKNCERKLSCSEEEINVIEAYWFVHCYSGPFMPMIDLTFVFDELKKMLKKWLAAKKKDTNHL